MTNEPPITKAAYCMFSGAWKENSHKTINYININRKNKNSKTKIDKYFLGPDNKNVQDSNCSNTWAVHKFWNPWTTVAPEPRQNIPTADIKDQTNLSLE